MEESGYGRGGYGSGPYGDPLMRALTAQQSKQTQPPPGQTDLFHRREKVSPFVDMNALQRKLVIL